MQEIVKTLEEWQEAFGGGLGFLFVCLFLTPLRHLSVTSNLQKTMATNFCVSGYMY